MPGITYEFKEGARVPAGVDREACLSAIQRLRETHGELTPPALTEAAQSKKSPLHELFQWDNSKAADEYRLWQARQLIASLVVRVVDSSNQTPVRAFVNVRKADGERAYVATEDARDDPFLRKQMLDRALAELVRWRAAYIALAEFSGVHDAINEAQMHIEEVAA